MIRVVLAPAAALAGTAGGAITLVEATRFAGAPALAAGALTALFAGAWGSRLHLPRGGLLLVGALGGALSMLPPIDTTLLSQDASLHRGAGLWLAREGTLAVADPALAALNADERVALFGGGTISARRMSLVRLPGGLVLPDLDTEVAYPSFSHLLMTWVGLAARVAGAGAVGFLGPLLAALALWAVGVTVALGVGGRSGAGWGLAAEILLALLLPEHWFGRFLMSEILGQALVWCAVAAAAIAAEEARRPLGRRAARGVAGLLCGACLGLAGFARLEMVWIFVPALLLARALLPAGRRLLPPLALAVFLFAAGQAALHRTASPTDYGNHLVRQVLEAYARLVWLVIALCRGDGHLAGTLLRLVLPLVAFGLLAAGFVWVRAVERRRPGQGIRAACALAGGLWLALLYRKGVTPGWPAARALVLFVPPALLGALALAGRRALPRGGLEIALCLLALDQIAGGRVADEQIWAARRLVPVVLPLVVVLAVRGVGGSWIDGRRPRSAWRLGLARGLLVVALFAAVRMVWPVLGRQLQGGAADRVRELAAELPPDALVLLAQPLDWTHLAAALWLGEGRRTLVLRQAGVAGHGAALRRYLDTAPAAGVWVVTGAAGSAAAPASGDEGLSGFEGLTLSAPSAVRRWRADFLEVTRGRRPHGLVEREIALRLRRVGPPPALQPQGASTGRLGRD